MDFISVCRENRRKFFLDFLHLWIGHRAYKVVENSLGSFKNFSAFF